MKKVMGSLLSLTDNQEIVPDSDSSALKSLMPCYEVQINFIKGKD